MVDVSGLLPAVGSAFVDWLKLFAAPLKNLDMLWIIVPIWASWLFAEFFQEKKGTSFGNAISNGVVMLFVGIDWVRYIIRQISAELVSLDAASFIKLAIAAFIMIFGLSIIFLGVKAKPVVRAIGRVREVSYLMLMFTPIVYGVVDFSLRVFFIIMGFLPVFYLLIEILDRLTPTPRTYEVEEEEKDLGKGFGKEAGMGDLNIPTGLGSDFGKDLFGSQNIQGDFQQQKPFPPQQQKFQRNRRF